MRVLLSTLLSLCLCGCAVGNPPPVVDIYQRDSKATKVTSGSHRVARGETLYSIAWRYGWDYRALAEANDIDAPYTIYPGQTLSFAGGPKQATRPSRLVEQCPGQAVVLVVRRRQGGTGPAARTQTQAEHRHRPGELAVAGLR